MASLGCTLLHSWSRPPSQLSPTVFHGCTLSKASPILNIPFPCRLREQRKNPTLQCRAVSKNNRRDPDVFIDPASLEPPEVDYSDEVGFTKFEKVAREADRVRQLQEEEYERTKPIFLKAIGLDPDKDTSLAGADAAEEGEDPVGNEDDDFYSVLEKAVALKRTRPSEESNNSNVIDTVVNDEEAKMGDDDVVSEDEEDDEEDDEEEEDDVVSNVEVEGEAEDDDGFEEFDEEFLEEEKEEYVEEIVYRMSLAELLDEAGLTPISVEGDVETEITGIQHDSREVGIGDLFVCCEGLTSDGHQYANEAVDRGASVLVISKDVALEKNVSAVVTVEDTSSVLSSIADAFYGHPSQKLAVVGITGTNGKTTTSTLVRSVYEAMGKKSGLLGTIGYFINSKTKLDAPTTTPDAVSVQKLMAKMVQGSSNACVMEVSSHALALGRCNDVDFDVAVFTNITRDHMDFHATENEYRAAKGKLFARMVDPAKHRKVVNVDDPNAFFFVAQGNPDVPVVTYSLESPTADVYALEIQLSLFETELLVRTPKGNIEISSGLLGRHNVYNILATVAVGIAIEAPLKHIVRGIEEVDAVPGRFELIDEEQAFAVIVDYAHTPDALARLLDAVRECGAQRVITVVGCGGDRDKGKRPIMAKIATDKSDICIFTSDNPRTEEPLDILDDMLAGVGWSMAEYLKWGEKDYYPPLPNGHRLFVYDVRTIAVRAGVAMGEEGDAVVIAGKGHENYQIIGTKHEYIDDREECREALQHVDALHAAGVDTSEFPWRVLESN